MGGTGPVYGVKAPVAHSVPRAIGAVLGPQRPDRDSVDASAALVLSRAQPQVPKIGSLSPQDSGSYLP